MGSFTQWGWTIYQITNEVFRGSKINKYLTVVELRMCPTCFLFVLTNEVHYMSYFILFYIPELPGTFEALFMIYYY